MARSNYVAAGDVTSPRESLSVTAAEKITTIYFEQHWSQGHLPISLREGGVYRCRPRPRATGDREEARGSLKTGTTELPVRQ